MGLYNVITLPTAETDLEDIYHNSATQGRWSFSQTNTYVTEIKHQIASLSAYPERFSYDEYTIKKRQYRSFQHRAHKVFYTVDNDTMTVYVAAILGSTTNYGQKI